jgi:hypothetical protein
MHLETSTKPHVHRKFEIFWTNIASTMDCTNFKNGPKIGLRPLGVNIITLKEQKYSSHVSKVFQSNHMDQTCHTFSRNT